MTKRKKWTPQEETQLKTLYESDLPIEEIARQLGKSVGSVTIKCNRLGLIKPRMDKELKVLLPRALPSVEEDLRMLAGALKTAIKPGLDKVEVQRLQAVANIAKTYKDILADYVNYREIERQLKEMAEMNATLLAEIRRNHPCQPDTAPMA
jgi:hypothetical protein